jgi:hypothetical protein
MSLKIAALAAVAGLGLTAAANADILAQWTFESSIPTTSGPHVAEGGIFAASSVASSNSGGTFSNPVGNGSLESFSSNGWNEGEFFEFQTSSTGYENLTISYGQSGSSTGPGFFDFFYSADGTTFTQFGSSYDGPDLDFSSSTFRPENVLSWDLSSISALDNDSSVFFRVAVNGTTSEGGGTIGSAGSFRVDDFTVNASAVPEPASLALLGLGGLALLRRRRS